MERGDWVEASIRLKEAFGEKRYPEIRVKIIWEKIKYADVKWLDRTVSHAVETMKDVDWPKEVAIERERFFAHQKSIAAFDKFEKRESKVFSDAETKEFYSTLRGIVSGKVDPEYAKTYANTLREEMKKRGKKPNCIKCNDFKVITYETPAFKNGRDYVFAKLCDC